MDPPEECNSIATRIRVPIRQPFHILNIRPAKFHGSFLFTPPFGHDPLASFVAEWVSMEIPLAIRLSMTVNDAP